MSDQATLFKLPYDRFLMQRMEFVVMCGDHLAANVLRVIEAEMIKRKDAWEKRAEKAIESKKPIPNKSKTWWVRLSQAQIIARLYMYDSAKLKKPESEDLSSPEWVEYRFKRALSISKATLKKAIELLKALGFLIEKSQPGDEFGAPIYVLNEKNIQAALEKLPVDPFTIFHHLGGVENIETGGESKNFNVPPENLQSGESKKSDVPLEENETGDSQNFQVDIDITIDPLEDLEIDNEIEGTGNVASELPTPAPAASQDYQPDFSVSQEKPYKSDGNDGHSCNPPIGEINAIQPHGDEDRLTPSHPGYRVDDRLDSKRNHYGSESSSAPARDAEDQGHAPGTQQQASAVAELSTSIPQSGKVTHAVKQPTQPSSKVVANGKSNIPATAQVKPQLTLLGGQVRTDYETIRACRLRLTANNIKALNVLGDLDGMNFVNLKETIETIEEQDLVKKKDIPIDPQALASEEGYWRFDKWLPVVVRNRQRRGNGTSRKPSNIDQEIEASRQAMKALDAREKVRA